MEPRVSPPRTEDEEPEVKATINISVRSSEERAVTTCEPTLESGDLVTFALTDVGTSFRFVRVVIDPSSRPLLLDGNTSINSFELSESCRERTFKISGESPPDDPDETRFFDVDATFQNQNEEVEVEVLRDDSCLTSANSHRRPRMIVII